MKRNLPEKKCTLEVKTARSHLQDDCQSKDWMFCIMDGKIYVGLGRPHEEQVARIVDSCSARLQELSNSAYDRNKWNRFIKEA